VGVLVSQLCRRYHPLRRQEYHDDTARWLRPELDNGAYIAALLLPQRDDIEVCDSVFFFLSKYHQ